MILPKEPKLSIAKAKKLMEQLNQLWARPGIPPTFGSCTKTKQNCVQKCQKGGCGFCRGPKCRRKKCDCKSVASTDAEIKGNVNWDGMVYTKGGVFGFSFESDGLYAHIFKEIEFKEIEEDSEAKFCPGKVKTSLHFLSWYLTHWGYKIVLKARDQLLKTVGVDDKTIIHIDCTFVQSYVDDQVFDGIRATPGDDLVVFGDKQVSASFQLQIMGRCQYIFMTCQQAQDFIDTAEAVSAEEGSDDTQVIPAEITLFSLTARRSHNCRKFQIFRAGCITRSGLSSAPASACATPPEQTNSVSLVQAQPIPHPGWKSLDVQFPNLPGGYKCHENALGNFSSYMSGPQMAKELMSKFDQIHARLNDRILKDPFAFDHYMSLCLGATSKQHKKCIVSLCKDSQRIDVLDIDNSIFRKLREQEVPLLIEWAGSCHASLVVGEHLFEGTSTQRLSKESVEPLVGGTYKGAKSVRALGNLPDGLFQHTGLRKALHSAIKMVPAFKPHLKVVSDELNALPDSGTVKMFEQNCRNVLGKNLDFTVENMKDAQFDPIVEPNSYQNRFGDLPVLVKLRLCPYSIVIYDGKMHVHSGPPTNVTEASMTNIIKQNHPNGKYLGCKSVSSAFKFVAKGNKRQKGKSKGKPAKRICI